MHVAGAQPDPVHRRQVADGVGDVGVLDQLRLGRGPGGEVQHEGVARERGPVRLVRAGALVGVLVGEPPAVRAGRAAGGVRSATDDDAGVVARHVRELVPVLGPYEHMAGPAALDAVGEVGGAQQRGGGDDDGAQLHRGERGLPQLGLVAEHDDDPVPGPYALGAQPVRDPPGAVAQRVEGEPGLGAVLFHDPQGGPLVAHGDPVEPVERPVEFLGAGPGESRAGGRVVLPVPEQKIPRRAKLFGHVGCRHMSSSLQNPLVSIVRRVI